MIPALKGRAKLIPTLRVEIHVARTLEAEVAVSELDEAWALGLAQAEARARAEGRTDIADYLALRTSNDLIRRVASEWLLTLFRTAAGEANRRGTAIQISTDNPHRFKVGNAVMVGQRVELTSGVRVLQVEIGWPRIPSDGFIRGGGLACANIKHVGIKRANEELRLKLNAKGSPIWVVERKHGGTGELHEADVQNHLSVLLGD